VWALSADGEAPQRRGAYREDVSAAASERDDTDSAGCGQQGTCDFQQGCPVTVPGWTVPEVAVEWLTAR
jgi:hypothetical protein